MSRWWEHQALRFECQKGCVQCCARPGWIYFDHQDVQGAADFLGMRPQAFIKRYDLRLELPGRWEMEVAEGKPCPFLKPDGCAIHPVKPKQCRSFPFWPENLASRATWSETARDCPGIGEGRAFSAGEIRRILELGG